MLLLELVFEQHTRVQNIAIPLKTTMVFLIATNYLKVCLFMATIWKRHKRKMDSFAFNFPRCKIIEKELYIGCTELRNAHQQFFCQTATLQTFRITWCLLPSSKIVFKLSVHDQIALNLKLYKDGPGDDSSS